MLFQSVTMDMLLQGLLFLLVIDQAYSARESILIYPDCGTNQFHIYSTDDGIKLDSRPSFNTCPESIAYAETDKNRLYWIEDTRPPSIGYIDIRNERFQGHIHHVDLPADMNYKSIQVDNLSGLVYFIANESLVVKSLEENAGVTLDIPDHSKPSLLAVDPHNKLLFWFDESNRELMKANMDGSNARLIARTPPAINAIALDVPEKKVYVAINDRMKSISYNGRDQAFTVSSGDTSRKVLSMALDSTRVFYTVENNPYIMNVNKTTEFKYGTLFAIRQNPDVVTSLVTSYNHQTKSPNQCSVRNGNCSQLCVTKGQTEISCLSGISTAAEVRVTSSGLIEVNLEGDWYGACADGFTVDEAIVACRNLRKYGSVKVLPPQPTTMNMIQRLNCPYPSTSLSTCLVTHGSACNSGAAAVDCNVESEGMTKETFKTLEGGNRRSEGRLEVFHQGAWNPACDSGHYFNQDAATALCISMGYQFGRVSNKFNPETEVMGWRQDFKCYLGAQSVYDCYTSPWQQVTCQPDDVIAVECFPQAPEIRALTTATNESTSTSAGKRLSDTGSSTTTPAETTTPSTRRQVRDVTTGQITTRLLTTQGPVEPRVQEDHDATSSPDNGAIGTVRLPDNKLFELNDMMPTDFPIQGSTEGQDSRFRLGPLWLVATIACVGTALLIGFTVCLSVLCYKKRKHEDEPFGIHSNPLVQQMSMMEQNELMMKYLEEKRQLGCLSDSRSSLNYNAAGVLMPECIDGKIDAKEQVLNGTRSQGNVYESIPGEPGARNDNAANEQLYSLQKNAKVPIWQCPLPAPPNPDDVYLAPVQSNAGDNYYTGMFQPSVQESAKDESNYDLPKVGKRRVSIDPRNPVM